MAGKLDLTRDRRVFRRNVSRNLALQTRKTTSRRLSPVFSCDYGCNHKYFNIHSNIYNVLCTYCNHWANEMHSHDHLSQVTTSIVAKVADLKARNAHRRDIAQIVCEMIFFDLGDKPSAGKVLSYVGQGSMTDIGKDVDRFWQSLRDERKEALGIDGVPESIAAAHTEMLQSVWRLALDEAKSSFDQERTLQAMKAGELNQRIAELLSEATNMANSLSEMEERLRTVAGERETQTELNTLLQKQAAELERLLLEGQHSAELVRVKLEGELSNLRDQRNREVDGLTRDLRDARIRMDTERQNFALIKDRGEKELAQSNQLLQSTRQQLHQVRDQHVSQAEQRERVITQLTNELKDLRAATKTITQGTAQKQRKLPIREVPRRKFLRRK